MKYNIVMGVDCGLTGGISILDDDKMPKVYKIPVKSIMVNKKKKNTYDMIEIIKLFSSYKNKKVLFFIEKQGVRQGEGSVSAMTIGKGFGQLLGAAYALDFEVIEVSPQSWKKHFSELITDEMIGIKSQMKDLRVFGKTLKDKEAEKENKKHIDKLGRQFKSLAKTEARMLVSKLYPSISDRFVKKNTDGLAESLLIALYGKNKGQTK